MLWMMVASAMASGLEDRRVGIGGLARLGANPFVAFDSASLRIQAGPNWVLEPGVRAGTVGMSDGRSRTTTTEFAATFSARRALASTDRTVLALLMGLSGGVSSTPGDTDAMSVRSQQARLWTGLGATTQVHDNVEVGFDVQVPLAGIDRFEIDDTPIGTWAFGGRSRALLTTHFWL